MLDTEPKLMEDLEARLDKTLVLIDVPILALMSGKQTVQSFEIFRISELLLGRSNRCDVVINDTSVSSEHAKITKSGDDYFLEDLKSTNGTFLNEKQVSTQKVKLHLGDSVRIGQTCIIYRLDQRKP